MKEFCLMVTYDCNWDCDFCITDTHTKPKVQFDELLEKLQQVDPNSSVSISGGEPGLVPKTRMAFIIENLKEKNCHINVNTNGLFFERFPEYVKDIDDFYYHCTENLEKSKGIILYSNIDYDKTEFMMVITDENCNNLEWFLDKYPNITFTLTGADQTMVKGTMGPKLSKMNGLKIYSKFKDRIHPDSYLNLVERGKTIDKELQRI